MSEKQIFYYTGKALTRGIIAFEGMLVRDYIVEDDYYVQQTGPLNDLIEYIVYRPHFYSTFKEAAMRAAKLRDRKIASLKKQLAKLENMTFTDEKTPS